MLTRISKAMVGINRGVVCFALFFLFQNASYLQAQQGKIKILLLDTEESYTSFYYQKRGLANINTINQMLTAHLNNAFPCAEFTAMQDIRTMINYNKGQQLLSGGEGAGDFLGNIGAETGSMDYILTTSFSNITDENHWFLSASLLHIGKKQGWSAEARASATAQGAASFVITGLIQEVVKQLSEAEVCPWLGTVTVTKILTKDTTSITVTSGDKSTTNRTITKKETMDETWSIEAVGKKKCKGTVKYAKDASYKEETYTSGNVPCFRSTGPCAITDDFIPGSFSHYLLTIKESVKGGQNFDNVTLKVVFDAGSGNYSLSILGEPLMVGKGESEEYEMTENSCGRCVSKDIHGPSWGTVWANWIVDGRGKITDHKLSDKQKIQEDDGNVTEIAWNLHK